MTDINHLLKKYSKSYVPGEKRSQQYNNMIHHQKTLQENIMLLDELNREVPETLQLNKCEIKILENLLKVFNNNLKYLHRKCKTEVILLVLIFYIKKMDNPIIKIEDYKYLKNKGVNLTNYSLIISRLAMYYMVNSPIHPTETTKYNHDLLLKNNGRWTHLVFNNKYNK